MSALSPVLRSAEGGVLIFRCPGCNESHSIQTGNGPGPRWGWNGNASKPTFTPSVLVKSGHYSSHHKPGSLCWCDYNRDHPDEEDPFTCGICHSFVVDGQIVFLGDCTHALAGKTVDLPPWSAS